MCVVESVVVLCLSGLCAVLSVYVSSVGVAVSAVRLRVAEVRVLSKSVMLDVLLQRSGGGTCFCRRVYMQRDKLC